MQKKIKEKPQNQRSYRTWSLYLLLIMKTLCQSLFFSALPNYLIYTINMDPELIGVISSSTALAYIITPFIGQIIAKMIGRRQAIILSLFLSSISYISQILFFTPIILVVMQLIEGLSLGLFWPNTMMEISMWQKISTKEQSDENFHHFNTSWNLGILGGYIIGFFLVILWKNDYIALIVACIIAFGLIPIGFLLEREKKIIPAEKKNNEILLIKSHITKDEHRLEDIIPKKALANISLVHLIFPAFIAWTLNIYFTMAKSMYNFIFPFNLKSANFQSYWRYLFIFLQQGLQVLGMNWIGTQAIRKKKLLTQWLLLFDTFCAIFMIFSSNIVFIVSATVLMGLSTGLKQGLVIRINFDYSSKTGSSKYINFGELAAGIGFGITPIWVGFLVNINYQYSYIILASLSSIVLIIFLLSLRKIDINLTSPPISV
ncbi:MFS transporter [Promethearchaeum syntrophicum]|uniref:MFS transporter n=1 Tax=Promethearchaeum syntrophicum TaxID=2594042 RepID=A0A5B9DDA1_9ARCH|nr:MFS transporter [Candidatus Prometheoarchaeum syntrophicum]QEE16733.1 Major Facilitator Superfamily protein [Candidatus Prometheoarchaeum syntrophicum]